MSKPDRWMPLYIGDYLADTMHLNAEEHGAYLLLIMHYWRAGPLPDDDKALATIARVERKSWVSVAPTIRAFFQAREGRLHHGRIDAELAAANDLSDKRRAAANARHAKPLGPAPSDQGPCNPHANADAIACADAEQTGCKPDDFAPSPRMYARTRPSASPSPLPRKEERKPPLPSVANPRGACLDPDWRPNQQEAQFARDLRLNPDAVADQFRDYWTAQPGAKGRKLDWPATWRNWCRRETERPNNRAAPTSKLDWLYDEQAAERAGRPDLDLDIMPPGTLQ